MPNKILLNGTQVVFVNVKPTDHFLHSSSVKLNIILNPNLLLYNFYIPDERMLVVLNLGYSNLMDLELNLVDL